MTESNSLNENKFSKLNLLNLIASKTNFVESLPMTKGPKSYCSVERINFLWTISFGFRVFCRFGKTVLNEIRRKKSRYFLLVHKLTVVLDWSSEKYRRHDKIFYNFVLSQRLRTKLFDRTVRLRWKRNESEFEFHLSPEWPNEIVEVCEKKNWATIVERIFVNSSKSLPWVHFFDARFTGAILSIRMISWWLFSSASCSSFRSSSCWWFTFAAATWTTACFTFCCLFTFS